MELIIARMDVVGVTLVGMADTVAAAHCPGIIGLILIIIHAARTLDPIGASGIAMISLTMYLV